MGELDDGGDFGGVRNHGAVAQGPVIAAAFAGAGGSHEGSPEDHEEIEAENGPGEFGESPH